MTAVIDPTVDSHFEDFPPYGAGAAATGYQQVKLNRYPDIDPKSFHFLPFFVETHGAFGEEAASFCKKLHKKWKQKLCQRPFSNWGSSNDTLNKIDLARLISIEVQRWNANMILDRGPSEKSLDPLDLSEISLAV